MNKKKNQKSVSGSLLKIVCISGLTLTLILAFALVFFTNRGKGSPVRATTQNRNFTRELLDYDHYDAPKHLLEGENPAQIEKRLSRLKRQARGVEEHLSVLKRLRALALMDRQFISSYEKAAQEAAETFSYSAQLAAVAADAIVMSGDIASTSARNLLKIYASRISQIRFESLELAIHILAGTMDTPSEAARTAGLERLISERNHSGENRELLIDDFLLKTVKRDLPGASLRLNTLLNEAGVNEEIRRMGAEFFYDHNNPIRAGELFSRLPNAEGRTADSLVLVGEISGARNIWFSLASSENFSKNSKGNTFHGNYSRSFYNLAVSSKDPEEELSWLSRLLAYNENSIRNYSIVRYTRLKDTEQSIAILEALDMNPILDLELLRRKLAILPPTRAAAEVWMLIGRNSEEESIYEWAAWYFDHQKLYNETERLLKEARRKGMAGVWTQLHLGLALLREGKINEGESVLKEAYASTNINVSSGNGRIRDWRLPANLGRIQENKRTISTALEYYETAASMANGQKSDIALLQMRTSRCLEALGRTGEAWRALERAVELDPENLMARRELKRLEGRK